MEKRLLNILRCPITHKGLSMARRDTLNRVNQAIEAGQLTNRDGDTLTETLSEALVTDDDKLLYPITNGIPVLLEGESVNLAELE
ncbi:MAG: Trm112 family protein [Woeseiaceae bacterium]|nr:Trm112 family protein [Woeseiaceae bacterium]